MLRHSSPLLFALAASVALSTGCATGPVNPEFPLSVGDAQADLRRIRSSPTSLARPVVVLGGWADPGFATSTLRQSIEKSFVAPRVVDVSFVLIGDFDDCRERVLDRVDEALGRDDDGQPIEVDVIAVSMGGVVARYAAVERDAEPARRLRIARLFTIASPHRGAAMAPLPTFDPLQIAMRPGSPFLAQLESERSRQDFPIIPYVRLGDAIVGSEQAAPFGQAVFWVPNRPLEGAHLTAFSDPRIQADIFRRLRGEPPHTATRSIKSSMTASAVNLKASE